MRTQLPESQRLVHNWDWHNSLDDATLYVIVYGLKQQNRVFPRWLQQCPKQMNKQSKYMNILFQQEKTAKTLTWHLSATLSNGQNFA